MSLESFKTRGALAYLLIAGALLAIVTVLAYMGRQSNEAWRTSVFLLLGVAILALVASLAVFIMALVGWRTPFRNRRLVRSALLAVVAVALCATPIALAELVWIPALVSRQEQARKERLEAHSLAKEGDAAPVFRIDTDEGLEFALGDQRGKVVLVNFFATWCGPCVQELPHLQELWNEHKDRTDFALIVIGREETAEKVKAFKKKHGFSFPMAADPEGAVFSLFAEEYIPRTYVISKEGKVCWSTTGFTGEEDFAEIKTALRRELSK
jgi:peroxiredoxin